VVLSSQHLDYAYRHESDANGRERIFLVRRVKVDKEEAASVAELELHRSRGWAYKWLKRYDNNENLEGLKDKPRSGRPPDITEEKLLGIKKELSENPSGWRAKEIMNIIYKKTGVRYHEVHIYRLLHKWGFSPKVPRKRFVNTASKKEKKQFKKRLRR
jgi:putative transposase